MRQLFLLFWLVVFLPGCISQYAKFPKVAETALPADSQNYPVLGLSAIKDNRSSESAGGVGGVKLKAGDELKQYIYTTLRNKLTEQGFNIHLAEDPFGEKSGTGMTGLKTVSVTLQSASIDTADALMFPAESEVQITAQVFSASGDVLFARQYSGHHSKRIGLSGTGKKEGSYIALAADQAIQNIINDTEFIAAIK